MKNLIFILISFSLLFSCKKDDKIDTYKSVFIGDFSLLPDSKSKFPYNGINNIIFEDSLKNEVKFKLSNKIDTVITATLKDSIKKINYSYKVGEINYEYKQDSLNISLMILMESQYFDSAKVYDELLAYRNGAAELRILVNQRDLSNDYIKTYPFDTAAVKINIFGTTFNNVFAYSCFRKESTKVEFNFDLGIVEFKDKNNKTWVYVRKE